MLIGYIKRYVRKCKECNRTKTLSKFANAGTVKGVKYKRYICRKCYTILKGKARNKKRDWLIEYKSTLLCERCGYDKNPRALHFHHKNNVDKMCNVGDMVGRGYSISSIKKEISKCIVLCANCHHEKHW
jgi:hypothetical protein|tara:strand:- start:234 stop:620 length:387 start_codon:yes stop_codon:yes gene_type:complete